MVDSGQIRADTCLRPLRYSMLLPLRDLYRLACADEDTDTIKPREINNSDYRFCSTAGLCQSASIA